MPERVGSGLAAALMAKSDPMPEDVPSESLAFGDAARECFDSVKAGDYEGFKMSLRDAIRIAQNEME